MKYKRAVPAVPDKFIMELIIFDMFAIPLNRP